MGIHYLDFDPFAGTRILGVQVQWPEEQGLRVRHTHTRHTHWHYKEDNYVCSLKLYYLHFSYIIHKILFTLQQTICFLRNTLGVSTHSVQTCTCTNSHRTCGSFTPSVRKRTRAQIKEEKIKYIKVVEKNTK